MMTQTAQKERVVLPIDGAIDQLYREHRQQLFTCALAVTHCADRAEDAVQEAFCRLFRLKVRPRNLKAYVFRAVRNAAIDQITKNPPARNAIPEHIFDPRPGPHSVRIFDPQPGPSEVAAEREFQQRAATALLGLAKDESETIVQHLYGNLTFREIAQIRETPLGTITSWYQRGLEKLRAALEEKP